jgi:formylglycine-generating enzyme required for sulfatase activity
MVEVGTTKGKSSFGLFDMVGNAWEWTNSDAKPYPNGKDFSTRSKNPKIIRGGFWGSPKEDATTTFRGAYGARNEKDYQNTSFRCAKSIL